MTHDELLTAMGGAAAVSRALGVSAADWRRHGVPFCKVGAVVAEARRRGVKVTAAEVIASHPATVRRVAKAKAAAHGS